MNQVVEQMDDGVLQEVHRSMIDLCHRGYALPIRWTLASFDGVPAGGLGDGLEIGGGDGFLASLVAAPCRSFVTTDSYRPRLADGSAALPGGVRRVVCDAARLPFANASFDFIFSSSVLE